MQKCTTAFCSKAWNWTCLLQIISKILELYVSKVVLLTISGDRPLCVPFQIVLTRPWLKHFETNINVKHFETQPDAIQTLAQKSFSRTTWRPAWWPRQRPRQSGSGGGTGASERVPGTWAAWAAGSERPTEDTATYTQLSHVATLLPGGGHNPRSSWQPFPKCPLYNWTLRFRILKSLEEWLKLKWASDNELES